MIKKMLFATTAAATLAATPTAFASTSTIPAAPPPTAADTAATVESTATVETAPQTVGALAVPMNRAAAPALPNYRRYRVAVDLDLRDYRRDRSVLEVTLKRDGTNKVLRRATVCLQQRQYRSGGQRRFRTTSCRTTDRFGQTGWVLRDNRTYRVYVPGTRSHYAKYTYSFTPDL
ncbi:hypothetical protein LO762_19400 [Actinocorallia sp. API 0066]|uniref:hypothetical protein n=1 Tax=Actinocorallia sp. API 0066 TaxID=2896846 RepID=UPI001E48192F|nr:hypothetical protein [Actinocorallia sp. API 0066]MCD0451348.1 hypothetical protein [Actinocorallia sp. API 0066]